MNIFFKLQFFSVTHLRWSNLTSLVYKNNYKLLQNFMSFKVLTLKERYYVSIVIKVRLGLQLIYQSHKEKKCKCVGDLV